jgi:hypothetical protein
MWWLTCNYNTCTRGRRASFLILLMMGTWRPKHVEWLWRNKTCTVLHQVGVLFDLYYDARKHKSKIGRSHYWRRYVGERWGRFPKLPFPYRARGKWVLRKTKLRPKFQKHFENHRDRHQWCNPNTLMIKFIGVLLCLGYPLLPELKLRFAETAAQNMVMWHNNNSSCLANRKYDPRQQSPAPTSGSQLSLLRTQCALPAADKLYQPY